MQLRIRAQAEAGGISQSIRRNRVQFRLRCRRVPGAVGLMIPVSSRLPVFELGGNGVRVHVDR
jgi:hypothetical protein